MKELKGKIDLLFDRDRGLEIKVEDRNSSNIILKVTVSPENVCALMSRQVDIDCDMEVYPSENIGKLVWLAQMEFRIPDSILELPYGKTDAGLREYSDSVCPFGWNSDGYFRSQSSLFKKGDEKWARLTIRAYEDEGDTPELPESGKDLVFKDMRCPKGFEL